MLTSDTGPGYTGSSVAKRFGGTRSNPRCDALEPRKLVGPNKTIQVGEDIVSSPITAGNFVDATPYNSTRIKKQATGSITLRNVVKVVNNVEPYRNTCNEAQSYTKNDIEYSHRFFNPASIVGTKVWGAYSEFSESDREFVRNIAVTKAKNSLRRGLTSLPMLYRDREQTLLTMKSKSEMIIDVVMRRHNTDLQRYRRLRTKRDKIRFARAVAAQHLEFIFGIMPLIEDLEGLAEYITQDESTFVKGSGTYGITSTVKDKLANPANIDFNRGPPYGGGYSVQSRYSARCSLRADIVSNIGADASKLGFTPLYTLYDVVPLSFILSWFSNFGHWIGSMDPLIGANFRTGSVNVRKSVSSDLTIVGDFHIETSGTSAQQTRIYDAGGSVHCSESTVRDVRTILTSEPDSEFELYNNLSFYSVMASVSLAIQRKLKLPKRVLSTSPFRYKGKKSVRNLPPIKWTKPNA